MGTIAHGSQDQSSPAPRALSLIKPDPSPKFKHGRPAIVRERQVIRHPGLFALTTSDEMTVVITKDPRGLCPTTKEDIVGNVPFGGFGYAVTFPVIEQEFAQPDPQAVYNQAIFPASRRPCSKGVVAKGLDVVCRSRRGEVDGRVHRFLFQHADDVLADEVPSRLLIRIGVVGTLDFHFERFDSV